MYPSQHFILGSIFSFILYLLFPDFIGVAGFFVIVLSGVLIDVDHYLLYSYRKKDSNLKNAYSWFIKKSKFIMSLPKSQRKNFYFGIIILHGIEILALLLFLSLFSQIFFFIFLGFSFHLFLDLISFMNHGGRMDRFSLIYDLTHTKKLRKID